AAGLGFAVTRGQPASAQSGQRCGYAALRVGIAGRHRCLQRGVACRLRCNGAYHRYLFHCSGDYLVYSWTGLLSRPLQIPTQAAGSACPAAEQKGTLRDHGANITGPDFGPGSAYPTLGIDAGPAMLRYGLGLIPDAL